MNGVADHGREVPWWTLIPWFIIGFALMSALRTVGDLGDRAFGILDAATWGMVVQFVRDTAEICLLLAMSAVGLTSMFAGLRQIGARPFVLGLFAAALIGTVSVVLISLFATPLIAAIGV